MSTSFYRASSATENHLFSGEDLNWSTKQSLRVFRLDWSCGFRWRLSCVQYHLHSNGQSYNYLTEVLVYHVSTDFAYIIDITRNKGKQISSCRGDTDRLICFYFYRCIYISSHSIKFTRCTPIIWRVFVLWKTDWPFSKVLTNPNTTIQTISMLVLINVISAIWFFKYQSSYALFLTLHLL